MHTTLITSVAAVVLLYVGTFALDAVDSITAMTLVLNGLAAPWVVVNLLGFLVARRGRYDPRRPAGLQPGPPRRALLVHRRLEPARRRSPGPPARCSACSPSQTELYTGPLANLAGGVDLSLARLRRSSPRAVYLDRPGRLARRSLA